MSTCSETFLLAAQASRLWPGANIGRPVAAAIRRARPVLWKLTEERSQT